MNTRLIGVCVLALVLASTAVMADAEVAVANADTEAQAESQAQAQVQAAAEAVAATAAATATESEAAAAAETETAAAAEATAEAAAETDAAAETETEAAAESSAEAAAKVAAEAGADAESAKPSDAKKSDAKGKGKGKTFKPTMINRDSRLAMRSQRRDIRYEDGSLAPILSFGPAPPRARVNAVNAVDADVVSFAPNSPFARRFARWADAVAERKQKYVTPTYADDQSRRRYVSFVPNSAFFAPRRPTHFEAEYTDEHALLNGDFASYFASLGPAVLPAGAAPAAPRTFEAEYDDEHRALNGQLPLPLPLDADYVVFDVDLDDVLSGDTRALAGVPSAYDLYGLPEFPALPPSARHLNAPVPVPPFSGLDDLPVPSGVHIKTAPPVLYPTGSGAKADLTKLDFALNRLNALNAQLRAAEAKVAASRLEQKALHAKVERLNRIRANLQRLAQQIAALETRVGQNPAMQAEVARVAASRVQGVPVLGEWLAPTPAFNN